VEKKAVPTLKEFAPRYLDEGARANRQKPSTLIQKKRILDFYLLPRFGELRWTDVDFTRGVIHVRRSEWEGHGTSPCPRADGPGRWT